MPLQEHLSRWEQNQQALCMPLYVFLSIKCLHFMSSLLSFSLSLSLTLYFHICIHLFVSRTLYIPFPPSLSINLSTFLHFFVFFLFVYRLPHLNCPHSASPSPLASCAFNIFSTFSSFTLDFFLISFAFFASQALSFPLGNANPVCTFNTNPIPEVSGDSTRIGSRVSLHCCRLEQFSYRMCLFIQ